MRSWDILHRPRGIILSESTKIGCFLRQSVGVVWSLLSEAKRLKATQVRPSGSCPLRLDGSMMARREAGPVTRGPLKGYILSS
jgi:hypothetical protein